MCFRSDILLNIIDGIRPLGPNEWQNVARMYKDASGESDERPYLDAKRPFNERLCNGGRKPTVRSAPSIDVERALVIQRKILDKASAGICSGDDDQDFNNVNSEDEDENEIPNDFVADFDATAPDKETPSNETPSTGTTASSTSCADGTSEGSGDKLSARNLNNIANVTGYKRSFPADNKSKNVRNSKKPRSSAATAIQGLAKSIEGNSNNSMMMTLMQQQAQQSQQTMQMMMQQNQMMMQFF